MLEAELTTAPQRVAVELGVEPHAQVVVRRVATVHDGATAAVHRPDIGAARPAVSGR